MNLTVLLLLSLGQAIQVDVVGRNGTPVARVPIVAPGCSDMSAPGSVRHEPLPSAPFDSGFAWRLQGSFPNSVFTDLSFADDSFGYASAELGMVYCTFNSGRNWTRVMNLGFPYYWYGVSAIDRNRVLVTGFNDSTGTGIFRWTTDAGATWDPIVTLDTANWFREVRFADSLHGIVSVGWNGAIWRTENGGRNPEDWTYVQLDPARGWFSGGFTYLPDGNSYITGITFCHSADFGLLWEWQHSIDPVFDGGVSFSDEVHGWTGGGQISAPVHGWIHRTTDAGQTWSDRLIETPEPIRSLLFVNETLGFAVGGNVYSRVGAIYSTTDGGITWRRDVSTRAEMRGIDYRWAGDSLDVWSAGFDSAFTGRIYKTRIGIGSTGVKELSPTGNQPPLSGTRPPVAVQPNPVRRWVRVSAKCRTTLRLHDASGRAVRSWPAGTQVLDLLGLRPGCYILRAEGRSCRLVILGQDQ